MRCPYCGEPDSRVLESRQVSEGAVIRRRRGCPSCDARFTTYERVESIPLLIIKKDGRREEFDRSKILRGLVAACQKRPITLAELEALVDKIEAALRNLGEQEIPSRTVGELVMDGLKELDEVAYVRFASVYRQFGDIQHFLAELENLLQQQKAKGDE